jgi:hypothetical protein
MVKQQQNLQKRPADEPITKDPMFGWLVKATQNAHAKEQGRPEPHPKTS